MQKAHDSQYNNYWKNKPDVSTPIIAQQLNRNEQSVDTIDDRVVAMDTTKANQSDMLNTIASVTYDETTGTFTFTKHNGSTIVVDTDIEKIATNWDFDDDPQSAHYQNLIITLDDGTVKYVDMSALITNYDFASTDTIQVSVVNGIVRPSVKDGSITGAKLQPNYLADITTQANHAESSATSAESFATLSESWAIGGTDTREGEDTQNSKYYADMAAEKVAELLQAFGISVVGNILVFGATFEDRYHVEVVGTTLVISEIE